MVAGPIFRFVSGGEICRMFITENTQEYIRNDLQNYFGSDISTNIIKKKSDNYPPALLSVHGKMSDAMKAWYVIQVENDTGKELHYVEDIGLYIADDTEVQVKDFRGLPFTISNTGSSGTLPKCKVNNLFYKAQRFSGSQLIGNAPVYECIASDLCDMLGFTHVQYTLCKSAITLRGRDLLSLVAVSEDYGSDIAIPLCDYLETCGYAIDSCSDNLKAVFEVFSENALQQLWQYAIVDFILYNHDRHAANIDVLLDDEVRVAPIFDCEACFTDIVDYTFITVDKNTARYDKPCHNCLGSPFLSEAVTMWPDRFGLPDVGLNTSFLLKYTDYLPVETLQNINLFVKYRWEWLHELRNM